MPSFNDVKLVPKKEVPVVETKKPAPPKKVTSEKVEKKIRELSWQASEYLYYEKTADWYWALAIITIALVIVSFLEANFLFGTFVVIACFAVLLYGARRPRMITITVSGAGIRAGDRLFPYDSLKSFWIFYYPGGTKELSLVSERMLVPHIKIPLGEAHPNEVRDFLITYLAEKKQEESFIDIISHWLKF